MTRQSSTPPRDTSADQGGWTRPGTVLLLLTTTLAWICWSISSIIGTMVWFAVRRESDGNAWSMGDRG